MTKIAIIYYSSTGHTYQLARAIEEGAVASGADVRVRKVRETASAETIAANPGWQLHLDATRDVQEATLDDLDWADGLMFGTPTRFGLPAAQLKREVIFFANERRRRIRGFPNSDTTGADDLGKAASHPD